MRRNTLFFSVFYLKQALGSVLRVLNYRVLMCFTLLFSTSLSWADNITVSAASSLSPSLLEIKSLFEKQTNHTVTFNFAASSVLARQIEYGFSSHLYISANQKWIDYLIEKTKLDKQSRTPLVANELVLASSLTAKAFPKKVPKKKPKKESEKEHKKGLKEETESNFEAEKERLIFHLSTLKKLGHPLIIADASHVPLGEYTKQALTNVHLFSSMKSLFIPSNDARSALAFLERGQADYGILYRSDAEASKKVRIQQYVPLQLHGPINYYLVKVCCAQSQSSLASESAIDALYRFLLSDKITEIFQKHHLSQISTL